MMNSRSYWIVLTITVVGFIALIPAFLQWQWSGFVSGRQVQIPPRVSLSVMIDGHHVSAAPGGIINVVQGTTITPLVSVVQVGDLPVDVALSLAGKPIESGHPVLLTKQGYFTLASEVTAGRLPLYESIIIDVTERPRYRATVNVESFLLRAGQDGKNSLDFKVVISSNEFDIKNIYLSHASLWLLDESNLTLDRLPVAEDEDESLAVYYDDHWRIHFIRGIDAAPLRSLPTRILITGSGWEEAEYIDFTTETTALPPHVTE